MDWSRGGEAGECQVTACQRVGIETEITLRPKVECGPLTVICSDAKLVPGKHCHHHRGEPTCKLIVLQELEVEIPITFSVDAECELSNVRCGPPAIDPDACLADGSGSDSGSDSQSGNCITEGHLSIRFWFDDESGSDSDSSGDCSWSSGEEDDR